MENKNANSVLQFKLLIKMLLVIAEIWRSIRDDVANFIEENQEDLNEFLFNAMCEFGELFDEVLIQVNSIIQHLEANTRPY